MTLLIRLDSSPNRGAGHFMRCLTIAGAYKKSGGAVALACEFLLPENIRSLKREGIPFFKLPNKTTANMDEELGLWAPDIQQLDASATALIAKELGSKVVLVDHYSLSHEWESLISANNSLKVAVLEDEIRRHHYCDLLIDYTLDRQRSDYYQLVPLKCELRCGFKYAPMKPEILDITPHLKAQNDTGLTTLGILMGGTDPANIAGDLLTTLAEVPQFNSLQTILFLGPGNTNVLSLEKLIKELKTINTKIVVNPDNFVERLSNLSFAISACGTTALELIYLKIPTLFVPVAENQLPGAFSYEKHDLGLVTELYSKTNKKALTEKFFALIDNQQRKKLPENIIDGRGADRIVDAIQTLLRPKMKNNYLLRPMHKKDLTMVLKWRNAPSVKSKMLGQTDISLEDHQKWFSGVENSQHQNVFIFQHENIDKGFIAFHKKRSHPRICTWGFYLAPEAEHGSGLGLKLGLASLDYGFFELEFDQIIGEVLESNLVSQKFHTRLGFKIDNQEAFEAGFTRANETVIQYSITKEQWIIRRANAGGSNYVQNNRD